MYVPSATKMNGNALCPESIKMGIILLQTDPSLHDPWTKTIFVSFVVVEVPWLEYVVDIQRAMSVVYRHSNKARDFVVRSSFSILDTPLLIH